MARSICSISLPEPMRQYVEGRVRNSGYASVSEYVRDLIRNDQQQFGDTFEIPHEAPAYRSQSMVRGHDLTRWTRR